MRRIEYKKGDVINGITIINELEPRVYECNNGYQQKNRRFLFECYCGNEFEAFINNVNGGKTISCGCYRKETCMKTGQSQKIHGDSSVGKRSYLYNTWVGIKARCFSKKSTGYHNYGGRGISTYKPWIEDYMLFKKWIVENLGERPQGYSLDRINNNGNYEPNNLRWATSSQQNMNKRLYKLSKLL